MSLRRYPDYRLSELPGIAQVPTHWKTSKIKWFATVRSGRNDKTEEGRWPIFGANGVIGKCSEPSCDAPHVLVGRVGSAGAVNFAEGQYGVSDNALLIEESKLLEPRFLYYHLLTRDLSIEVSTTAQPLITGSQIKDQFILIPTADEQRSISDFLDRETAKIDALIAEQEKLITLLAEKRQATISHAVTKGLNPDAQMKDSGVPGLEAVPTHWEVAQLKHLCSLLKDGTHLPPARVQQGVPLLSVRNIDDSIFALRDDDSMISEDAYSELCRSFVPQPNDVLMAIVGATIGKVAVVPEGLPPFHIQRSLAIFRTDRTLTPKWLFYCISSGAFQRLLWEHVGYSAQPGIYLGTLQNFKIPLPPLREQEGLCKHLDEKLEKLEGLAATTERAVTLLKERRSALIAAAVTGQIDVRGAADAEAA